MVLPDASFPDGTGQQTSSNDVGIVPMSSRRVAVMCFFDDEYSNAEIAENFQVEDISNFAQIQSPMNGKLLYRK